MPDTPTTQRRRALVLGGTGFIGGIARAGLAGAGYAVTAVARRPRTAPYPLIAADLLTDDLDALLAATRPAVIVNAAGAGWDEDAQEMSDANTLLVVRMLAAVAEADPRIRFVQIGSSREYAEAEPGFATSERAPTVPNSPYGRSKLRATEAVLAATRAGTVQGVVLRLSTVIGPRCPRAGLVGQVLAELAAAAAEDRTAELRLFALRASQDFLASDDLSAAVVAAAERPDAVGAVINLGYGAAIPVRNLVTTLIEASGVPTRLIEEERRPHRGALAWQRMDITMAAHLLGWAPRRSLRDALTAAWRAADPRSGDTPASVEPRSR